MTTTLLWRFAEQGQINELCRDARLSPLQVLTILKDFNTYNMTMDEVYEILVANSHKA